MLATTTDCSLLCHCASYDNIPLLCLFTSVYLSSLPVAHLIDAHRRRLVVTGYSARVQNETNESSTWFFNVLGVLHRHMGTRLKVSSERQLVIVRLTSPGIEPTTLRFHVERSKQPILKHATDICVWVSIYRPFYIEVYY